MERSSKAVGDEDDGAMVCATTSVAFEVKGTGLKCDSDSDAAVACGTTGAESKEPAIRDAPSSLDNPKSPGNSKQDGSDGSLLGLVMMRSSSILDVEFFIICCWLLEFDSDTV